MSIIRNKRTSNFTTIPNALINDSRLRWNDLGLLVYLLSKPDTWAVRVDALVKERGIGKDAVYEILKRLREAGYARLIKFSDGSTEWTIYDTPESQNKPSPDQENPDQENPDQENPDQENPDQDFPDVLVNTDVKKRLSISKERVLVNTNSSLPEKKSKPKKSKDELTLFEFLEQCKEKGEPAIPADCAVMKYATDVGIPDDFLRLGWIKFKSIQEKNKRQKDWRLTFLNYLKEGWLRLWYIDDNGNYSLTTSGKQLQREVA